MMTTQMPVIAGKMMAVPQNVLSGSSLTLTDMTLEQATSTMLGLVQQGSTAAHQIGNDEGKTLLNLQGVPMSEVPRLIQALQQGLDAQPSLAAK